MMTTMGGVIPGLGSGHGTKVPRKSYCKNLVYAQSAAYPVAMNRILKLSLHLNRVDK